MASTTYLQQAYLAYFGRPADVSGLSFYASKTEAQVVAAFSASTESQAFFGSLNTLAQINTIYQNLFNRAAEPAGLVYWAAEINAGRLSLAQASMGILAGAQNDDKLAVTNKLAAATAFTAALDTSAEMIGYQGSAVITSARAYLASVGSTAASLTAATATAALNAYVATVVAAGTDTSTDGSTFTLTTESDDFLGDTGDDTFTAGVGTMAGSDVLDGAEGDDSITARMEDGDQIGVITNIETINIIARGDNTGAGTAADFIDVSDLDLLTITGSTDYEVTNVSVDTVVEVKDSNDAYTIGYADVEGSADAISITADGYEGTITMSAEIESIAITASGSDSVITLIDIAAAAIETITVSGSAGLELVIDAETDALTSIDGSDATGDNTYDVSAVALDMEVTGGSGDDTLAFADTLNSNDVIDGGTGSDEISAEVNTTSTIRPTATSIESLDLGFTLAGTFDARNMASLTSIELSDVTAAATLTRVGSAVTALSITEDTANTNAISITYAADSDTAVTLSIGASSEEGDAVADLGAITIANNAGDLTINSDGDDDNVVNNVTADDAADLTIDATTNGLTTLAISAAAAASVTIDATAGDIETTTIAAAAALSFTLNATGGDITVTDATLTDATTITLNATGGAIATGDLTTAADDAEITVTADGESANAVTIDLIDADFATVFDLTATDGAAITVTNIVTMGFNSEGEDIDNAITLTATGIDADDNGASVSVTIADLDAEANAVNNVVDLVTLVSDAEGSVSFTVTASTDTGAAVTEVDATSSEGSTTIDLSGLAVAADVSTGAGGSTTTLTSAADVFEGGSGDDSVTGGAGADDITLGDGSDTVVFTTVVTEDVVQDFNVEDDIIQFSDAGLSLDAAGGGAVAAATTVSFVSQATAANTAIAAATNILVFTDITTNAAVVTELIAIDLAANSTAANADIVVLYNDGNDTFVCKAALTVANGATAITAVTLTEMVQLIGVDISDLTSSNFAFVA